MYAATAFIIMEAGDIMLPRLGLPDWTVTFIIILLIVGFPITVILSWIFDFTSEGIKKTESVKAAKGKPQPELAKRKFRVSSLINAVLIVIVLVLAYPKIFNRDKFKDIRNEDGRISVAVMPFENMTGDASLDYFRKGLSSLIINGLGNSTELAVLDDLTMFEVTESVDEVFKAQLIPVQNKKIAEKARTETYITGNFHGRDSIYWIMANLYETKNNNIIKTFRIEGNLKSSRYMDIADILCNEVKDFLEIKVLEQEADYDFREAYPKSAEAYRYFIEGMNNILTAEYMSGVEALKKALEIDSTFTFASFYIAFAYNMAPQQQMSQTKVFTEMAHSTKENLPVRYQNWVDLWYACYISESMQDIIHYCNLLEESGIDSRLLWYDLGVTYNSFIKDYDKAIGAFERVEEMSLERGTPWKYQTFYIGYGRTLHNAGNHVKEKEIYETGLNLFPRNIFKREIFYNMVLCALTRNDTTETADYIEKYVAIKREMGQSADNIELNLGNLYRLSNKMDQAVVHYRKAIELNPQFTNQYLLSYALIHGNINVSEGLSIIENRLKEYLNFKEVRRTKGWGYYKMGYLEESLQLLESAAEDYTPWHEIHDEIKEVQQALAKQNSE